jgi:hypothetical protein
MCSPLSPVPRLIAIEVDRNAPPDIEALRADLIKRFSASLDDHRRWQRQIRTVTRSFALGGLAILLLVGAATTAIIVSATRSALATNREIVEVLHFVGATDRYIAREFERHFLRLGIRAGLVARVCHGRFHQHDERNGDPGRRRHDHCRNAPLGGKRRARHCRLFAARWCRRNDRRAVHADVAIRRLPYPQFQAITVARVQQSNPPPDEFSAAQWPCRNRNQIG